VRPDDRECLPCATRSDPARMAAQITNSDSVKTAPLATRFAEHNGRISRAMFSPSVTDASARAAPMIDQTNRGQVLASSSDRPAGTSRAQAN